MSDAALSESEYQRSRNPLHVWEAIAACVDAEVPLPGWVQHYLYGVAVHIVTAAHERPPQARKIDQTIAAAVGLRSRGKRNPLAEPTQALHEFWLAHQVFVVRRQNKHWSWEAVYAEVALRREPCSLGCSNRACRQPLSVATVRRAWGKRKHDAVPAAWRAQILR